MLYCLQGSLDLERVQVLTQLPHLSQPLVAHLMLFEYWDVASTLDLSTKNTANFVCFTFQLQAVRVGWFNGNRYLALAVYPRDKMYLDLEGAICFVND